MTMEQQRERPILNSSENVATEQTNQQQNSPELQAAIDRELDELNTWLAFKVKNELVSQIYTSIGNEDSNINIASVKDVLVSELDTEKMNNLNQAAHLNRTLPYAANRKAKYPRDAEDYGVKDLVNLQHRIDIHREVITFIKGVEATGDDGLYDLAEAYTQEVQVDARDEVISILKSQKEELERGNEANEAKISKLEAEIGALTTELEFAKEIVENGDTDVLESEIVKHLSRDTYSRVR